MAAVVVAPPVATVSQRDSLESVPPGQSAIAPRGQPGQLGQDRSGTEIGPWIKRNEAVSDGLSRCNRISPSISAG